MLPLRPRLNSLFGAVSFAPHAICSTHAKGRDCFPPRPFLFCGFALVVILSTAACSSSTHENSADVVLSTETQPDPPRQGNNLFTAKLATANGQPLEGAKISLEADMTHPGMAPSIADMQPMSPGRYQAQLNLAMPGDYSLLFHITLADGRHVEREIQLRNVHQ